MFATVSAFSWYGLEPTAPTDPYPGPAFGVNSSPAYFARENVTPSFTNPVTFFQKSRCGNAITPFVLWL